MVEARVHRARVVERAVVPVPARLTHQGATPERVRSLLSTIVHRERAVVPVPAQLTHQGATSERGRSLLYTERAVVPVPARLTH